MVARFRSTEITLLLLVAGVALDIGLCCAQPRAPITWDSLQMLVQAPNSGTPYSVYSKGDTVCLGFVTRGNPMVRITGNNGTTWSQWHFLFDTTGDIQGACLWCTCTSSGIITSAFDGTFDEDGLFRSVNLGQSWISPTSYINGSTIISDTKGDTIILRCGSWFWTADGGQSYSPRVRILQTGNLPYATQRVTGTNQWLFATECQESRNPAIWTFVAFQKLGYDTLHNGPIQQFTFEMPHWNDDALARFDDEGNGILCCTVDTIGSPPDNAILYRYTSHDFGTTWSSREQVSQKHSVYMAQTNGSVQIIHEGNRWVTTWQDSMRDRPHIPAYYTGSIRISFSANRCCSWYPPLEAAEFDSGMGLVLHTDLEGNRIQIFGYSTLWNNIPGNYYWRVQGIIHPDTLPPRFSGADTLLLSLFGDTTLHLSAIATDNDSLWRVRFVVKRVGHNDSTVLPLLRGTQNRYSSIFTVPHDTAEYLYYYVAEDMWENRTCYPDSARTHPFHFWVVPVTSVKEQVTIPTEPLLRAFPNPVNGMITFTGRVSTTQYLIKIHLYNINGEEIASLEFHPDAAGRYRAVWDCRNAIGDLVASGVYFAQLVSITKSSLVRFSIVR